MINISHEEQEKFEDLLCVQLDNVESAAVALMNTLTHPLGECTDFFSTETISKVLASVCLQMKKCGIDVCVPYYSCVVDEIPCYKMSGEENCCNKEDCPMAGNGATHGA